MGRSTAAVQLLVESATKQRLASLWYRKGPTDAAIPVRLIEPYSFVEGEQDLMIRCYQVEQHGCTPEKGCGWRFFMAHKIVEVKVTDRAFKPRRKITLPTGEVTELNCAGSPNWEEGRRAYRDLVGDALADGVLDAGEVAQAAECRRRFKLRDEDVRYVHASIYHRCLGAVLGDGFVSQDEIDQVRYLHRSMHALGWCVGD